MNATKYFFLLILLFNQSSQANIFSTVSSTCFDYVNEHKTLSAFAGGVTLGALSIGCVWYYTNLLTKIQSPYKKKSKEKASQEIKGGSVSMPLQVPCFFYPDDCLQESAKVLFRKFLEEHTDFVGKYIFKCTNLEDYIQKEYCNNKSPVVFIRGDGRPSDNVALLKERILTVHPLYVVIEPTMTERDYNAIKTSCSGDSHFILAYKQSFNSGGFNYEVPRDEKNKQSRMKIVKKIQELYGK